MGNTRRNQTEETAGEAVISTGAPQPLENPALPPEIAAAVMAAGVAGQVPQVQVAVTPTTPTPVAQAPRNVSEKPQPTPAPTQAAPTIQSAVVPPLITSSAATTQQSTGTTVTVPTPQVTPPVVPAGQPATSPAGPTGTTATTAPTTQTVPSVTPTPTIPVGTPAQGVLPVNPPTVTTGTTAAPTTAQVNITPTNAPAVTNSHSQSNGWWKPVLKVGGVLVLIFFIIVMIKNSDRPGVFTRTSSEIVEAGRNNPMPPTITTTPTSATTKGDAVVNHFEKNRDVNIDSTVYYGAPEKYPDAVDMPESPDSEEKILTDEQYRHPSGGMITVTKIVPAGKSVKFHTATGHRCEPVIYGMYGKDYLSWVEVRRGQEMHWVRALPTESRKPFGRIGTYWYQSINGRELKVEFEMTPLPPRQ